MITVRREVLGAVLLAALAAFGCRMQDDVELEAPGIPLTDASGEVIGQVRILEGERATILEIHATRLDPGPHGVHVHASGVCEPPFTSAGSHVGLDEAAHGFQAPEGPHAGDLPNLFAARGSEGTRAHFRLALPASALADADGSSLVVHAGPDDYLTDPAGASGSRVACAVLSPPAPAGPAPAAVD